MRVNMNEPDRTKFQSNIFESQTNWYPLAMTRREYSQPCSLACALDSIGERWALLIVRELLLGPLRFSELVRAVGGSPTDVLTKRLRDLERDGIVGRRELPPPASAVVYELTEFGRGLELPMLELARWGIGLQSIEDVVGLEPSSLANGLRVILRPPADFTLTLALHSGGQSYVLRFKDGRITASRGMADKADVTMSGAPIEVIAALVAPDLFAPGVEIEGERSVIDALRAMVDIPERLRAEALASLAPAVV
jgi:DNA-binding HxlR family transcriptional regulator